MNFVKSRILGRIARSGFVKPFALYSMAAWCLKDRKVRGIVDGGAYDGKHAQYLSQLFPKALIYAFEPLPERFDELAGASARNTRIIPVKMALSDSVGNANLNCNSLDSTSSFLDTATDPDAADLLVGRGSTISHQVVSTTTLDRFASQRRGFQCDLLKLDVQGYELPALRGARETLKYTRAIIAEIRFKPLYDGDVLFPELDRFIAESGFRLQCISEITHQPRDNSAYEANALWMLKSTV